MSARWKLVPAELPAPHILVNGEPVHELRGPVADVYAALVGGAPKASEDVALAKMLRDKIITEFADECDGQDVIWVGDVPAIVASVLKLLEGAQ